MTNFAAAETRVGVCLSQGRTSTSPRFHLRNLTVSQPRIWCAAVPLSAPSGGAGLPVGAEPFPARLLYGASGARGQEGSGRRQCSGLGLRRLTTLCSWFISSSGPSSLAKIPRSVSPPPT